MSAIRAAVDDPRGNVTAFRRDIDRLFMRLMFAQNMPDRDLSSPGIGNDSVFLSDFDGALCMLPSAFDLHNAADNVFRIVKPGDVDGKCDIRTIQEIDDDNGIWLQFQRHTLMRPTRQNQRQRSEWIIRHRVICVAPSGKMERYEFNWGYRGVVDGYPRWGQLVFPSTKISESEKFGELWAGGAVIHSDEEVSVVIQLALGFQFSARYDWSVLIGLNNYPRIRFATDPEGVRDVFKFRDMLDGEHRRAALCHWVESHYRRTGRGRPDVRIIEAYLRGKTDFVWNGLRCSIEPSPYDLEQYKKGKLK